MKGTSRDGPFDIPGGGEVDGLGFFLATSYFFSLFFAQHFICFKSKLSNLQQVFF